MTVLNKAQALCLALQESEEFKKFQDAKEVVLNNPEAKARLERYLELVHQASVAEKDQIPLSAVDKAQLDQYIQTISFYPETARFMATRQDFFNQFKQIYAMLQAVAQGKEIPGCNCENKEKSAGCSGSCSDCGC